METTNQFEAAYIELGRLIGELAIDPQQRGRGVKRLDAAIEGLREAFLATYRPDVPASLACNAEHDGWVCSLRPGHAGDHEAWASGIATEWEGQGWSWPQARRRALGQVLGHVQKGPTS